MAMPFQEANSTLIAAHRRKMTPPVTLDRRGRRRRQASIGVMRGCAGHSGRNQTIRRIAVKTTVSALALSTAIFAIWGATTIFAHNAKNPNAATASSSINVMQMMVEARNLPEEKFDAN
jgi:hypothetical protein